jgi:outer membrane receptor protein involved in Fe transport
MADDIRQSYSWPDFHRNRMAFVTLKASQQLSSSLLLEGNLYYRQVQTDVLNSNVNNQFDTTAPAGPGNQPTGNATNQINQYRPGASVQLSSKAALAGHKNQWVLGGGLDAGRTEFTQGAQEAGASRDTHSNSPVSITTSLHSQANAAGLYATDTYGLSEQTFVTASGRYNHATVRLMDQLGTALNGDHSFKRFNPALGLAYNPSDSLTTYASYNEGMRVPTPVELSCADPNAPCSLPNAFASDPALKPVISRSFELGARGRLGASWSWSAAMFRTSLQDDIQFISSGGGATSAGYFQNVGRTLRQGLELGLAGKWDALTLSANFSQVDATFQTPLTLNSPSNSTALAIGCATCTDILVRPGNRMPGAPRHTLKFRVAYAASSAVSVGLQMQAQSSQYARGDENNQDVNGPVPGFAVFNLDARWRVAKGWETFVKVDNLFDRRHSNFGTLGQNVFTGPGNSFDPSGASWRNEQFRTMGVPRGIWLGLNLQFGDGGHGA